MPSAATIPEPRLALVGQAERGKTPEAGLCTRVMVADRHALVRAGLQALLEGSGRLTVVGEAATGDEAVALARRIDPDVVVIDAQLPGLDCIEASRRMLTESGVAVMLLISSDVDDRVIPALRAGVSGLLHTDAPPAELVRTVEALAWGESLLSPSLARRLITELAARPEPVVRTSTVLEELTPREREVVGLVALGDSNAQIAEQLVVTPATAKTHVSRAMVKLAVRSRAQLVVFAYEAGIAQPRVAA